MAVKMLDAAPAFVADDSLQREKRGAHRKTQRLGDIWRRKSGCYGLISTFDLHSRALKKLEERLGREIGFVIVASDVLWDMRRQV